MEFIAIGISKYQDVKDTFKTFKSDNFNDARHYIINHFDCSLEWSYMEKPDNINIVKKDWQDNIFILSFTYINNFGE